MSAAELFENIRTGNTGAVAALLEGGSFPGLGEK